jgi:hypothetical protein
MARRQARYPDADVVRLEARRTGAGLYLHRIVRLIFELPGRRARAEESRRRAEARKGS